jgi:hypothetical protein
MDAAASGGFARRTKSLRRTAKSCGPGAATVASILSGLCWGGNGDNKRRSPGRARISCKAIARGKPGCLGCTCQNPCAFSFYHCTRCCGRSRRPAFPAPLSSRGANEIAELGQIVSRERTCALSCRPGGGRDPYAAADAIEARWRTACRNNDDLWLWAPAFAGATGTSSSCTAAKNLHTPTPAGQPLE